MGDLTSAGAVEQAVRMRARIEAIGKLRIMAAPDGVLEVDAEALTRNEYDVRFWQLQHEGAGLWSHWQSGEAGTLGQLLDGIVCAYLAPTAGEAEPGTSTEDKVPCPRCNGSGRIAHRVPGVPASVCRAHGPCPACWPRDENGDMEFWSNGRAGWVTEDQAALIQAALPETTP